MALDSLRQDLRYTFRSLKRDAAVTTSIILIAGFGIGASATVFSVVHTLLLRPLPFAESDRLVWISNRDTSGLSRPRRWATCWICASARGRCPRWRVRPRTARGRRRR